MSTRRGAAVLAAVLSLSCGSAAPTGPGTPPPVGGTTHVLVGAGDIGVCGSAGSEQTAAMLDRIEGTVFTAGDNAYFQGSERDYRNCYDPTWGRHRNRTRPAPGNHEYESSGGAPYYAYFGSSAGLAGLGYYSFTLGNWLVLSLNSNVPAGQGSPQHQWVAETLGEANARCVGAIWHHPLFSSSQNGPAPMMRDIWSLLQQAGAELVIVGHEHAYERFAPLDASGRPAPNGIRQIIAGTGGAPLYQFSMIAPGSEARISSWGLLKLTLGPDSYAWEFISVGGTVRDAGSAPCR